VKAHVHKNANTHEICNNMADKLAKEVVNNMPEYLDVNDSHYDYYYNNNNNYINAWHKYKFKEECNKNKPTLSDNNDILKLPDGDAMRNELRILTFEEASIINRIRMGYLTKITDVPWMIYNECSCDEKCNLTVKHFLLECKLPEAVEARTKMRTHLIELNPDFSKDEYFNNTDHLLYPHLGCKASVIKTFENLTLRTEQIKWIIEYCRYRFPD